MHHFNGTLRSQVPRYIIVSAVNTVLAYGLYAIFIFLGFHYSLAALLPGIISIYIGYLANRSIVFKVKKQSVKTIFYYYLFYLLVYLLNIFTQACLNVLGFNNDYVNGAIALFVSTVVAFSVNKWVFFKNMNRPGLIGG